MDGWFKVKKLENLKICGVILQMLNMEEMHDVYEEEIEKRLQQQREDLNRKARAMRLAALRAKDESAQKQLQNLKQQFH